MLKDAKQTGFKLLRVDGGASQNNLLMQLQADAIQVHCWPSGPFFTKAACSSIGMSSRSLEELKCIHGRADC